MWISTSPGTTLGALHVPFTSILQPFELSVCSDHLLLTPLVQEGLLAPESIRWLDTWPGGQVRLTAVHWSHVLTALERRVPYAYRVTWGCAWGHSKPAGATRGRLGGDKQVTWLWLSAGGGDCLAWVVLWPGRELKPTRLRTQWGAVGPADREPARGGSFPTGRGRIWPEQGNSWLSLLGPVRLNDGKAAHGLS